MDERNQNNMTVSAECRAKINLYLDILSRRPDGYHDLSTVMQSVGLSDLLTVSVAPSDVPRIETSYCGRFVPQGGGDTAADAARAFIEAYGRPLDIKIKVEKRIPFMAGLGGGSADAAGVLACLCELTGTDRRSEQIRGCAISVGADVPFCLEGGRRICHGVGEAFSDPLQSDGSFVLIAKPERGISTGAAFAETDRLFNRFISPRRDASGEFAPGDGKLSRLYNVFEECLPCLCPESGLMIDELKRYTPLAALTGSGSAVYGLFDEENAALAALDALRRRFDGAFFCLTRFATEGVKIIN